MDAGAQWLANAKAEVESVKTNDSGSTGKDDDDDINKRRNYLALQRDRLIEKKKTEREKKLDEFTTDTTGTHTARPKSARVARQVTATGKVSQNQVQGNQYPNAKEDKNLAMRVALAQRLKKEVIDKSPAK